ncbi:MAG: hypothetical protein NZT61_01845 [Deltaproteobacteria bacterium]|nr:hypothetical protein [Deltaproteobacteria bacterium]MCX7952335.1 hypothetical protein [Deltaproteobacteria bacterium]
MISRVIIFVLIYNACFCEDIRSEKNEVIIDYVAELERTVEELLHKVVFLENELSACNQKNNSSQIDAEFLNQQNQQKNVKATLNEKNQKVEIPLIKEETICPAADYVRKLEVEIEQLKYSLEEATKKIAFLENQPNTEKATSLRLTSETSKPDASTVPAEITSLRHVLLKEIERIEPLFKDDKTVITQIREEVVSAKTYSELANAKSKISSIKKNINKSP